MQADGRTCFSLSAKKASKTVYAEDIEEKLCCTLLHKYFKTLLNEDIFHSMASLDGEKAL